MNYNFFKNFNEIAILFSNKFKNKIQRIYDELSNLYPNTVIYLVDTEDIICSAKCDKYESYFLVGISCPHHRFINSVNYKEELKKEIVDEIIGFKGQIFIDSIYDIDKLCLSMPNIKDNNHLTYNNLINNVEDKALLIDTNLINNINKLCLSTDNTNNIEDKILLIDNNTTNNIEDNNYFINNNLINNIDNNIEDNNHLIDNNLINNIEDKTLLINNNPIYDKPILVVTENQNVLDFYCSTFEDVTCSSKTLVLKKRVDFLFKENIKSTKLKNKKLFGVIFTSLLFENIADDICARINQEYRAYKIFLKDISYERLISIDNLDCIVLVDCEFFPCSINLHVPVVSPFVLNCYFENSWSDRFSANHFKGSGSLEIANYHYASEIMVSRLDNAVAYNKEVESMEIHEGRKGIASEYDDEGI